MGHWLDALAKSVAARKSHRHASGGLDDTAGGVPAASQEGGLTRRDVLKRAGVIGVAWTVPTVLSAQAPAAAASAPACLNICGGTCPPCGPGSGPCSTGAQCASGLICQGGLCLIPFGNTTPCTASGQCQSANCSGTTGSPGVCLASWPGSTCSSDAQCLSNKCNGGSCFGNVLGGLCRTTQDCTDNTTCSSTTKTCGGAGATCANNNKCVSNRCQGGICRP